VARIEDYKTHKAIGWVFREFVSCLLTAVNAANSASLAVDYPYSAAITHGRLFPGASAFSPTVLDDIPARPSQTPKQQG
jgi:hypothetical protein